MPKRHNNHTIEDASRRQFANLLPDMWVTRDKVPDYGIDLEVEIFDESGDATGLMFNVQLRGTDNPKMEYKSAIKVDQYDYFESLNVPTLLVRFCRPTANFFWRWAFTIEKRVSSDRQKTFTVKFGEEDKWNEKTVCKLGDAVRLLRLIKDARLTNIINLEWALPPSDAHKRFLIEYGIAKAVSKVPCLSFANLRRPLSVLRVNVTLDSGFLFLTFSDLLEERIVLNDDNLEKIDECVLYVVAALCKRVGLREHARQIANIILRERYTFIDRQVCLDVARALEPTANDVVDLAILNGLEDVNHNQYRMLTLILLSLRQEGTVTYEIGEKWHMAALPSAKASKEPFVEASLFYNLGNLAKDFDHRKAITAYNRARKIWPKYWETYYFPPEVAGTLFDSGKYSLSAKIYRSFVVMGKDASMSARLGDAELFTGNINSAFIAFFDAVELTRETPSPESFAASFKADLCAWLKNKYGDTIPRQYSEVRFPGDDITPGSDRYLKRISKDLEVTDALHSLSNFNLGVHLAEKQDFQNAMFCFFICALRQTADIEAWSNVIVCAFNINAEMLAAAIITSIHYTGVEAYHRLRHDLVNQGVPVATIERLDELIRDLTTSRK